MKKLITATVLTLSAVAAQAEPFDFDSDGVARFEPDAGLHA